MEQQDSTFKINTTQLFAFSNAALAQSLKDTTTGGSGDPTTTLVTTISSTFCPTS